MNLYLILDLEFDRNSAWKITDVGPDKDFNGEYHSRDKGLKCSDHTSLRRPLDSTNPGTRVSVFGSHIPARTTGQYQPRTRISMFGSHIPVKTTVE